MKELFSACMAKTYLYTSTESSAKLSKYSFSADLPPGAVRLFVSCREGLSDFLCYSHRIFQSRLPPLSSPSILLLIL